jgi:multicomponent Na+:H+ antiporter subunit D
MTAATIALVAFTLAIALYAGPLYELSERAAASMLDTTAYRTAVLGP